MVTTKHNLVRMSQRGITRKMMDTVIEWGSSSGDKFTINKKLAQEMINEMEQLKKVLLKIKDKGGVTVVIEDDLLITTYNTNSHNKY
ncbi:hypothetical protein WCX49_05695 [Sulfurimonas sp. HSL-1656]|uniref:hypothetical protein n=1 Tax=Thiomicrolovo subterrani TaxID=3131934 RepID=UPI0031F80602